METHGFISDPEGTTSSPRPSPGSSSCNSNCNCKYPVMRSILMALLVSLAIIAGLVIFLYLRSPQVPQDRCSKKLNVTRSIEKVPNELYPYQYKIYKIPKTGAYLIHGEVNMMKTTNPSNSVILFGELRGRHNIKHETIPNCTVTVNLVVKTELEENTMLYVKFNLGEPNVVNTAFTIYEM